jgi:hypothetical protein
MIFDAMYWPWYMCFIVALFDGCLTGAVCRFLWNIDDFIDKSTPTHEDYITIEEDTIDLNNEL